MSSGEMRDTLSNLLDELRERLDAAAGVEHEHLCMAILGIGNARASIDRADKVTACAS